MLWVGLWLLLSPPCNVTPCAQHTMGVSLVCLRTIIFSVTRVVAAITVVVVAEPLLQHALWVLYTRLGAGLVYAVSLSL